MIIGLVNTKASIIWSGLFKEVNNKSTVVEINVGDNIAESILEVDVIVFTGGADIDPKLYDENHNKTTVASSRNRDLFELAVARMAANFDVPMVGICRGAQLLCVANGGKLVQDVNNHTSKHMLQTMGSKQFLVSSTHHQMMVPMGTYTLMGWAQEITRWDGMPKEYLTQAEALEGKDVEVVYWHKTNSLGFQYHPEYMNKADAGYRYFVETTKEMLAESNVS